MIFASRESRVSLLCICAYGVICGISNAQPTARSPEIDSFLMDCNTRRTAANSTVAEYVIEGTYVRHLQRGETPGKIHESLKKSHKVVIDLKNHSMRQTSTVDDYYDPKQMVRTLSFTKTFDGKLIRSRMDSDSLRPDFRGEFVEIKGEMSSRPLDPMLRYSSIAESSRL